MHQQFTQQPYQSRARIPQHQHMEHQRLAPVPQQKHMDHQRQAPVPQQRPMEAQRRANIHQQQAVENQRLANINQAPFPQRAVSSIEQNAAYRQWYANLCCPLCNTGTPTVVRVNPHFFSYTTLHSHIRDTHPFDEQALLNAIIPNSNADDFMPFVYDYLGLRDTIAERFIRMCVERETPKLAGFSLNR
jgi:hypothetical protein